MDAISIQMFVGIFFFLMTKNGKINVFFLANKKGGRVMNRAILF